jgi:hypothetical protein
MDSKESQDLIFKIVKEKSILKQDLFNNTLLNFRVLKQVLKEVGDALGEQIKEIDDRVIVEYRDVDEHEVHLRIAGDILIFNMHTNVFKFDQNNSLWKTSYLKGDESKGYAGVINIYNFLNDSFKYNRVNDAGYMVARLFINKENHYMVQGKRQLGFLYNDLINSKIDKEQMKAIVQSVILYTLDFDLLVPPYDMVKEVSVHEMKQISDGLKLKTAKRLGFKFDADHTDFE